MESAQPQVNAIGFSLRFNPAQLTFVSARLGEDATTRGASLTVNGLSAPGGQVGLLLGLPPGQAFPAGARQLVRVTFRAPAQPSVGSTEVGFGGAPVVREVVDVRARTLASNFVASAVTFGGSALQFGASGYVVSESAGAAHITVTRSGNVSGAATVDYATSDGTASERSDYTTTLDTLRFEAGEQNKTITVPVVDDVKAEGDQSFLLTLSNATAGATLGGADSVEVVIADDDLTDSGSNPADSTEFFVRQHYRDFLSRESDATGFAFWANNIESCGADAQCREVKRIDTSAAFFLSIEFQETGFLVHRLYRAAFNRLARYREFVRDSQEIGRGVVVNAPGWEARLEANKAAFVAEFAAREDFASTYAGLSNAQYVDALNFNTAGSLSQAERDALLAGLNANTETRATVLRKAAEDSDFRARETSPAFVLMQYFGYLRRGPDDPPDSDFSGYNFWLSKLNSFGGDYRRAEMVKAFISSDEYRRRFAQ